MHLLGLTSRYAQYGISMGTFLLVLVLLRPDTPPVEPPLPLASAVDAMADTDEASTFFAGPTAPCFTLEFTETATGDRVYRPDFFGGQRVATEETLRAEIREELLAEFSRRVWRDTETCLEGAFTISLSVDEQGRIGPTMLMHHATGGTDLAGHSVLNVLNRMRADGYAWPTTTGTAGEVSFGLRFRLER